MTQESASPAPDTRDGGANVPSRLDTVTSRTILVAVLAAVVATMVAAGVSVPLVRAAAEDQARQTLANLADVTATTLENPSGGRIARLRDLLASQDTEAFIIVPGAPVPPPVPDEVAQELLAGNPVSETVELESGIALLEGRPLDGAAFVLLASPEISKAAAQRSVQRIAGALVVGLVVAVVIAVVAARRLTRPMRRVAQATERLAAGERDVQVQPAGPAEVAEIADSVNRLSRALTISEGRQREFLLSVSHELRTPLTAVAGYAEAMADGIVPPEDVPRTAGIMVSESRRLERLVADLLDLSRLGAANLQIDAQPVDVVDQVRQAGQVWSDRCNREGLELELRIPAEPLVLRTDPVRVRQILDNLAENALRVTPTGGRIVFEVRADGADGAVIEVRDTGPGLTDGDLDSAFQPAALYSKYRGLRPVGSGVGLALVGTLAERLGGAAEAGHAPEGGARFTVSLPIEQAAD